MSLPSMASSTPAFSSAAVSSWPDWMTSNEPFFTLNRRTKVGAVHEILPVAPAVAPGQGFVLRRARSSSSSAPLTTSSAASLHLGRSTSLAMTSGSPGVGLGTVSEQRS